MDSQYPIGTFSRPASLDRAAREEAIRTIAETPGRLRKAIEGLDQRQLDTPYRDGGWTVRQVVHHLPDSHMNALVRFKLALTEEVPTIKPYHEDRWARLADAAMPVDVSLQLLDAVHARWVVLLQSITDEQWNRQFVHPESGQQRLDQLLALYAWHGPHHTAQITALRKREGW